MKKKQSDCKLQYICKEDIKICINGLKNGGLISENESGKLIIDLHDGGIRKIQKLNTEKKIVILNK